MIALAALWLGGAARAAVISIPAEADVGLPFWCDWSYDWEARCYRDDGPRLPIGGVDDKVWRAALRFPLAVDPARRGDLVRGAVDLPRRHLRRAALDRRAVRGPAT